MNRVTGISASLATGLLFAFTPTGAQAQRNMSLPQPDREFVHKAAQAGLTEVQEGRFALDNGVGAQIHAFAQRMIDDHTKANNELQEIASKIGATLPAQPNAMQEADIARLQHLRGPQFDQFYSRHAVADHRAAVALFRHEASYGQVPELRHFAARTLPTIESHLSMIQGIRAAHGHMPGM